jgi:hypothetical protein
MVGAPFRRDAEYSIPASPPYFRRRGWHSQCGCVILGTVCFGASAEESLSQSRKGAKKRMNDFRE